MSTPLQVASSLASTGDTFLFFDGSRALSGGSKSYVFWNPTRILTDVDGSWVCDGSPVDPFEILDEFGSSRLPVAGMIGFEFAWLLDDLRVPPHATATPSLWVSTFEKSAVYDHDTSSWDVTPGPQFAPVTTSWRGALETPCLSISGDEYEVRVERARAAIYEGDVFEVNYTERFSGQWSGSDWHLYLAMRERSTGDYFGYFQCDDFSVASVSPELFLQVDGRHVVARPIKGTARAEDDPERDRDVRARLLESEKDRAENIMIVDLMRNDLTRFCELGSVSATEICALETFAGVHHLVSTVEGELAPGYSRLDALVSAFPAGSITGAPKPRSIELIAELEQDGRGPYTGTLFFDLDDRLVSNVLIRTATVRKGLARYGAGGAVVSDSDPASELREAYVKAAPFLSLGVAE